MSLCIQKSNVFQNRLFYHFAELFETILIKRR
jgi:predicted TPR repeat methyltransferase